LQAQDRVSRWSSLLILGLYFLKVGLQIGFGGFDLQASTGVALTAYVTRGVIIAHSQKKKV
jgi:hypothetical protein